RARPRSPPRTRSWPCPSRPRRAARPSRTTHLAPSASGGSSPAPWNRTVSALSARPRSTLELAERLRLGERRPQAPLLVLGELGIDGRLELVQPRGLDAFLLEPRAEQHERVPLAPAIELAVGPILAGIAPRVADESVGDRLDEVRAPAGARVLGRA